MDEPVSLPLQDGVAQPSLRPRTLARRTRLAGYAVGVAMVVAGVGFAYVLATNALGGPWTKRFGADPPALTALAATWQRSAVSDQELADRVGVRIVGVTVSGGGGLVDLRYQVVDPNKAMKLTVSGTPPGMIDDATGVLVNQLLDGSKVPMQFRAGSTYYMIFQNPGNMIQRGGTVRVFIGDAEVERVAVR
jgi:hypothetical protein